MPSILRELQAEWNALVPAAREQRIPRVRLLGGGDVARAPLETIAYRRAKLEWLRSLLGGSTLTGLDSHSFGVEIECYIPRNMTKTQVAQMITDAGVICGVQSLSHDVPRGRWKVTTDGSLGDYVRGCEFVSPPLRGEEGFRQLKIVCDILTRIGCKVNKQCGLHVHVGVGSEDISFFKNLVRLYRSAENSIDQFMPPSRRRNGSHSYYCNPMFINEAALDQATTVNQVTTACNQTANSNRDGTRYRRLNLKPFFAQGTVEFRHHSGTVDTAKITNWVKLCLRMVLAARASEKIVGTIDELLDAVGADQNERAFFKGRVAYFGGSNQVSATTLRVTP